MLKENSRRVPGGLFWTIVGVVVLAIAAIFVTDRWGTAQSGSAAEWVAGILTFIGIAIALYQSAIARGDAARAEAAANEASAESVRAARERAQDRWELELARRIETELMVRRRGMELATEILQELATAITKFARSTKDAAFNFEDHSLRRDLHLELSLHWVNARPRIGVAALPINTSQFVHTIADKALPEIDALYARASILSEAETAEEVAGAVPDRDILADCHDELMKNASSDFSLDRDAIRTSMIESMPPKPS